MAYRQNTFKFVLLLFVILLTACGSPPTSEENVAPPTLVEQPTVVEVMEPTVEAQQPADEQPQPEENTPQAEVNPPTEEIIAESSNGFVPRPHREEPAPPDAFVADSAEFFGNTQSPQLIEIFTYW